MSYIPSLFIDTYKLLEVHANYLKLKNTYIPTHTHPNTTVEAKQRKITILTLSPPDGAYSLKPKFEQLLSISKK